MKVFADYHHGGLYHALHLMFVERLGWELYRPVGLRWAKEGVWQYSKNPDTIKQYLDPAKHELRDDGYYYWYDKSEEIDHKCLTFEQFLEKDIDLIIGSVCQHELSFRYLKEKYKPSAVYARLLGNSGEPIDFSISRNIIDTTNLYEAPPNCNRVVWRQEFPDYLFYYEPPETPKRIRSYLNCFNESPYYTTWLKYKEKMPDFEWRMHGLNGDDGFITPVSALAESMRSTGFIWHIKHHGEGYGHIVHNAFAVGRPLITVKKYYKGKIAYPMMIDGETCIDLGGRGAEGNIERIKHFAEPERHEKMCENVRAMYEKHVDFDKEAEKMRVFLDKILGDKYERN